MMKVCTKCGILKPLDNFNRQQNKRDGHASQCAICHDKYQAEHQSRPEIKLRRKECRAKHYAQLSIKERGGVGNGGSGNNKGHLRAEKAVETERQKVEEQQQQMSKRDKSAELMRARLASLGLGG